MSIDFNNLQSIGGNIWSVPPVDEYKSLAIAQKYQLSIAIAQILVSRGIELDDVADFIDPKLKNLLPDPNNLKDMQKTANRFAQAVINKQKVGIIGDYDVDGATSSSLLKLFLESVGIKAIVHIPERDEGYGPSKQVIDSFVAQGCELIVSVDCGTTAFDVFEYAKSKNVDIIVLDHHEPETKLPDVFSLVNPKRLDEDNNYPYLKYMAAVGVVFVTIVAINRELKNMNFYANKQAPDLTKWLDIVALGTVCDVVPLLGLNRAFVRQGLKIMASGSNIGIKTLIDKAQITQVPTSYHLGYLLGPRINAGGRVGVSSIGSELLSCQDAIKADVLADKLSEFNSQRKEIEAYVMLGAIEALEGTEQKYPIAFVYDSNWHQGVIGIVAGKLKEKYNLPSFVMSVEADEVKGSARSVNGLDIGALIIAAKEKGLLTKGGGHTMAAGFSLQEDKLEAFRDFAGEYVAKNLGNESIRPVLQADGVLDLNGINLDLVQNLELLEPYGAGNLEPKFIIKNAKIIKPNIVGSGHISCFLSSLSGASIKAIAFRVVDSEVGHAMLNQNGDSFSFLGTVRKDIWQGQTKLQFIIEDIARL